MASPSSPPPAAFFNENPNQRQQKSKTWQNSQLNLKEIDTFEYVQLLHKLLLFKNQQQLQQQHQQYERNIIYLNSPIETLSYNISSTMISMAINRAYLNVITFFK
ncbi:patatin-like phospholipase-like protein [Drosophila innubila nudivirus]|uniref:Patatin-like phospholipase-like protein n=1 Tax=Drosophila innubila nudivirus TaxID=2057187 RepID=A0A2H4UX63_9VIRU|nr:patatin-like phospholipase-like protein [Drosophila innubila nudivirus]ATZ81510.1 patatin-like phospholipase-like protein [Drosophila innubila nudivirus]